MNLCEKKTNFSVFEVCKISPEIFFIVSEKPSGHFFIERTMQVLDGSDFYFIIFGIFSCFEPTYFGTLSENSFNMRLTTLMVHKKFMYFYITVDG